MTLLVPRCRRLSSRNLIDRDRTRCAGLCDVTRSGRVQFDHSLIEM